MKFKWKYIGIALVVAIVLTIIYFSRQPGVVSATQSSYVRDTIPKVIDVSGGIKRQVFRIHLRKSAHFFLYALLGLFIGFSLKKYRVKSIFFTLIGILLFALSDEYHQTFIPGRSGELRDVGIDFLGGTAGIILAGILRKITSLPLFSRPK